ncbi:hypothetical protein TVAG_197700 [Trichomonas vaginalis G3]|uniref:Uncharacterized protein n=1 Tax=Trichomonas vaginalis (strain ATCC PRA-98 / G3) TaxID=412133 RepID=A2EJI7_TRIV3|nr:hypothetical protein TVAGG3_0617730 [Trichomonas vaginalis G3]EAY07157.1 hypothetical protein TVAG_197700 [Trichomonas vaginalis G3]KAI5503672.1 hypothetical protein TVAGG3_0617730 [Trichomonas vaginalis G3]|eukprot:XP_001319380.1 hypothetical protein [Trichomonas vaginalis G3]
MQDTELTIVDARMQHLSFFINTTIQQVMTEKTKELLKSKHIDPIKVTKSLEKALMASLKSEREQFLQDTIDKLEQTIAEKNSFELELKSLQKKAAVKNSYLQEQNAMLREKYMAMKKNTTKSTDELFSRSTFISSDLQSKDTYIDSTHEFLRNTKSLCNEFKNELKLMRKAVNSQVKELHTNLNKISHDIKKYTKICNNQQNRRISSKLESYINNLDDIKTEGSKYNLICTALLEILHEIHPTNKTLQEVNTSTIDEHIGEVEIAIREIPDVIRSETQSEMLRSVYNAYPEYKQQNINSLTEIINSIVEKRLKSQEQLYDDHYKKLKKKEHELRARLQKVLDSIPKEPIYTKMSTFSMAANADHEKIKWEKRKKYLDETIKIVESLSPKKSHSPKK